MSETEPCASIDPSRSNAAEDGVRNPESATGGSWVTSFVRNWVPVGVVLALLTIAVNFAARPLDDPDLWWHLLAGDGYVFQGWSLANPPPLTPFATVTWFSRSWLPEVAVAPIQDVFGLPGVAWVYGLGLVAVILATYISCRHWGAPLASAVATLLAIVGASASITERPQLFAYVLLVVVTTAWLRAAETLRPPWWILPVMWVWSASHGTWLVGVAIGIGAVLGMVLDKSLNARALPQWLGLALGGFAVGALSPVGVMNLVAFAEVRGSQQYIAEYLPPSIENFDMVAALLLVAVVAVPVLRSGASLSWVELTIVAHGGVWILYTVRSVAWGALMIAPIAARSLQGLLGEQGPEAGPTPRERRVLVLGAVAALVVLAALVPSTSHEPGRVPLALDDELVSLPQGTVVLNDYELGGWLEWRHRHLAPVIDGNTNGYRPEDVQDHVEARRAAPGWQEYVESKDAHVALLDPRSPLALALQQRLQWELVARDDNWALLRDPDW